MSNIPRGLMGADFDPTETYTEKPNYPAPEGYEWYYISQRKLWGAISTRPMDEIIVTLTPEQILEKQNVLMTVNSSTKKISPLIPIIATGVGAYLLFK